LFHTKKYKNILILALICCIKISSTLAQNQHALDYFGVQYPKQPSDIESMQAVLQKNNSKNLKCVYQFDTKDKDFEGVNLYETYLFNQNANTLQQTTISLDKKRDTLNKIEKQYEYNINKQIIWRNYKDRRGDEPNRTEKWTYDSTNNLVVYSNQNPLTHDTLLYVYETNRKLKNSTDKKWNTEFETRKMLAYQYNFKNDTLEIKETRVFKSDFYTNTKRHLYFQKDTVLYEYQQKANDTTLNIIGKYFFNKNKQVLKYAAYDPSDRFLPTQTTVFSYYKSGQLRSIHEYKGAGNLQKIVFYRATAEIQSVEYIIEKNKREYFYNPITGLPLRTDMYHKGIKKGQINYIFF
jgi:hypothetical protein